MEWVILISFDFQLPPNAFLLTELLIEFKSALPLLKPISMQKFKMFPNLNDLTFSNSSVCKPLQIRIERQVENCPKFPKKLFFFFF